jgi:hypothetical protein
MSDSVRQWKRKVQVVIGKAGSGLMIENLRVQFEVAKTIESAPNIAVIRIFNLHPDNEGEDQERIRRGAAERRLRGRDAPGVPGEHQARLSLPRKNDYITEIEAGDGDKDFARR